MLPAELDQTTSQQINIPLFLESASLGPFKISIDYKPKNLSIRRFIKTPTELINVTPVDNVTILLHKLRLLDILGWDVLFQHTLSIWYPEIKRTLPLNYISGLRFLNPFISVGSGVVDLVTVPWNVYLQDGDVKKGIHEGAVSFVNKVAKGAVNGAVRLTVGATTILENIGRETNDTSKYANQPSNIVEGFQDAYSSMYTQIREASDNILVVPLQQYQLYGAYGYMSSMAKAVPLAIIKPMIGTTEGMSKVILGAKNQFNKEEKKIMDSKYKTNNK